MKKQFILFSFVLFLGGCASADRNDVSKQAQQEYVNSVILKEIHQSSLGIEKSLKTLNQTNELRYGTAQIPFGNISDEALNKQISISWYGPVEQVLQKIAIATGYKVQYFGKQSPFPIVVILGGKNEPLKAAAIDVLRDVAVQAARQAQISINADAKIISVRYRSYDAN